MKLRIKQFLASLMVVMMVFSCVPETALAEGNTETSYQYSVETKIPDQTWTGELPDLANLKELAEIEVTDDMGGTLKLTRGEDFTVKASTAGTGKEREEAYAEFTGMGKYASVTIAPKLFYIVPQSTTNTYTATVDTSKIVYNGAVLDAEAVGKAATVIKNGNENLKLNTGYTVEINPETAKKAGDKATITIKIKDEKDETKAKVYEETVTIGKRDFSTVYFVGEYNELTYNGKAQEPAFTKISAFDKKDGTPLELTEDDYDEIKSFKNNTNVTSEKSTASAVISASSKSKNYTGEGEVAFEIQALSLSTVDVDLPRSVPSVVYNGSVQNPEVTLKVFDGNGRDANEIPAADYEVVYPKSENVGEYHVTLKPTNTKNLVDTLEVEDVAYKITKASLKDAKETQKEDVPAGTFAEAASSEELLKYFTIKVGDYELKATDFTTAVTGKLDEMGETCTVKITASEEGNFEGTYSFTYVTTAHKFAETYTSKTEKVFTGSTIRPTSLGILTEKNGTATISEDDYTVTDWSDNTNVGTAVATIKGKGEYEGQIAKVEFKIAAKDLSNATVAVTGIEKGSYYVGSAVKGGAVTVDKAAFDADSYEIVAKTIDETNAKLTYVTVNFKGNYSGSVDVKLNPEVDCDVADLDNAVVKGDIPAGLTDYDEAAIKKYITVTIDDTEVGAGAYSVVDIAPVDSTKEIGTLGTEISFTIKPPTENGSNVISGQKKNNKIKVVQRDIKDLEKYISVVGKHEYTGEALEPADDVQVNVTGTDAAALENKKDYTLSWSNNKDAGKATVTLTGKGNYKGTASATFEIDKIDPTGTFELTGADTVEFKTGTPDDNSANITLKAAAGKKYEFTSSDYTIALAKGQSQVNVGDKVKYAVTFLKDSKNYIVPKTNPIEVEYSKVITKTVKNAEITLEKDVIPVGDYKDETSLGKVTVKVDGQELAAENYEIKVTGETGKVTATLAATDPKPEVVITFKGSYAGKDSKAFTIVPKDFDINDLSLEAPTGAKATFSGQAIVPEVKDGGKNNLKDDNETMGYYTVVYKDADGKEVTPINVGTYTATIKATDNYGGKEGKSVTYTINAKTLSETEFNEKVKDLALSNPDYKGAESENPKIDEAHASDFEVKSADKTWDGTSRGKAEVGVKEGGNYSYTGTKSVEFTWNKGNLDGADPADFFEIEDQIYNAEKACEPTNIKAKEGMDLSPEYVTIKNYGANTAISSKTAYAEVKVTVPTSEKKYSGYMTGKIYFNIIEDPDQVAAKEAAAEEAAKAAEAADAEAAEAAKTADEKAAAAEAAKKAADEAAASAQTADEKAKAAELAEAAKKAADEAAAAAKTAEEKAAAAKEANDKSVAAAETAYGKTSDEAKAAQEKADAAAKAAQEKAAATKAADEAAAAAKTAAETASKAASDAKASEASAADKAAADAVIKQLNALNSSSSVADAQKAIDAYNKLTAAQKAIVDANATAKANLAAAQKKVNDAKTVTTKKISKIKKAKLKKKTFKASTLKKKKQKTKIKVTKVGDGKLTFKKTKGSKKIKVSKTGKVTLKKGLKKGKYKIKVMITMAESAQYKACNKVVTLKIKVK